MRVAFAVVAVVLGGCDKLFDLEHVTAGPSDGPILDVPRPVEDANLADAGPCVPVAADEDGDGIKDNCDACPTVASNDDDADRDGLPDACDPDFGVDGRDRILLAATFGDPADFAKFTPVSATYSPLDGGRVVLASNGLLRTMMVLAPTKIEIRLAGIGGASVASTTTLSIGGVSCRAGAGGCTGGMSGTCLTAAPGGSMSEYPGAPANVRTLDLMRFGTTTCQLGVGSSFAAVNPTTDFAAGPVDLMTNATGNTVIESIVVYGSL